MTAAEIAAGGAWYLLYALVSGLAARLLPLRSPALLVVALACVFAAASAVAGALAPVEANYWRAFTLFSFLTLCHLMIFGAAYKSISLRILSDLLQATSTRMRADLVFSRYIEQESFQARIKVMISQGLASQSRNGIFLTSKGRKLAASVGLLQRLYGIEKSG